MGFGRVQGQIHLNCVLSCFQFFCVRRITAIISLSRNLLAPETRYVCAFVPREGVICAQLALKNDTRVEFSHTRAHIRAFYTRTYFTDGDASHASVLLDFHIFVQNRGCCPSSLLQDFLQHAHIFLSWSFLYLCQLFPWPLSPSTVCIFEKSWSLQGNQHPLLPLRPRATVLCVLN